jgi:hypothetical protein
MSEEPTTSQPKTIRLTPDEIRFLDEHEIKLSDLAHSSIEFEKQKKEKQVTSVAKQKKVQNAVRNGLFMIIGIVFLWTLNITGNIVAIAIIAGLGISFLLAGSLGLFWGMKTEGMFNGIGKSKQP